MSSFCRRVFHCALVFAASPFFLFSSTLFAATQPPAAKPAVDQIADKPMARVNRVTVIPGNGGIDVEITTTQSVALRSQVATAPDRLILDFPNALPSSELHDQIINRGEVKGLRVGLFAQHPPVTRVVIDLKSAEPYRIFPSGKTVIVKLETGGRQAAMAAQGGANVNARHISNVSYTPAPAQPVPALQVDYRNDRLSILAHNVSLSQVLNEVQRKTGAQISVPPAAAQELMVANIGLLPVREALSALLNGSRFNFIMVSSDSDPSKLKSLILTFLSGGVSQPAIVSPAPAAVEGQPEPEVSQPEMQPQPEVQPQPEMQPQPQEGAGQQEQPQEGPPPH
jgi:hypothetical protein